ncbi:MAG: histidine kinase, partial [Planctomycetota bacterium]
SAELREARGHVAADRLRYDELGPLRLRLTTPQAGTQLLMRGTPPPQPPWFQLDLGEVRAFDRVALVPAIIGVAEDEFEPYAFPPQFRVDASDSEDFATFQLLYDSSVANADPKSPFPLVIDTSGTRTRYLRITLTELANVAGRWTGALSEIVVLAGGRNLALNASVTAPDAASTPPVWDASYLVDGKTPLGQPIVPAVSEDDLSEYDGVFFRSQNIADETWFEIDLGQVETIDAVRLFPVHARQGADYPGYAFPRRFRIEAIDDLSGDIMRTLYRTDEDFDNPGNNAVTVVFTATAARRIRVVCEVGSLPSTNKVGYAEVQVLNGDVNLASGKAVTAKHWRGDRPLEILVDGDASYGRVITLDAWFEHWRSARDLRRAIATGERDVAALLSAAKIKASWAGLASIGVCVATGFVVAWGLRRKRRRRHAEFRMRFAQDLHDEIGSNLAAITRIGEIGEATASDDESREDWRSTRDLAGECTDSLRETLWLLGGPRRREDSLAEGLRSTAARMLPDIDLRWEIHPEFAGLRLDGDTEREIVRSFKSVLANIARSSHASRVTVAATRERGDWRLEISDDGEGFDASRW